MSALHLACKLCQPEAVELLLGAGYSACERAAAGGLAPLHFAAMGPAPPAVCDLPRAAPSPTPAPPGAAAVACPPGSDSPHTPAPLTPNARGAQQGADASASPEDAVATARPSTSSTPQRADAATSIELVASPGPAGPRGTPPQKQLQHQQQQVLLLSRAARLQPRAAVLHVCQVHVAEALLAAGADPRVHDQYGRSPLSYAAGAGNPALVARLLAAGCDPLRPDCKVGPDAALDAGLAGGLGHAAIEQGGCCVLMSVGCRVG